MTILLDQIALIAMITKATLYCIEFQLKGATQGLVKNLMTIVIISSHTISVNLQVYFQSHELCKLCCSFSKRSTDLLISFRAVLRFS